LPGLGPRAQAEMARPTRRFSPSRIGGRQTPPACGGRSPKGTLSAAGRRGRLLAGVYGLGRTASRLADRDGARFVSLRAPTCFTMHHLHVGNRGDLAHSGGHGPVALRLEMPYNYGNRIPSLRGRVRASRPNSRSAVQPASALPFAGKQGRRRIRCNSGADGIVRMGEGSG
jgi:hypothetical protein